MLRRLFRKTTQEIIKNEIIGQMAGVAPTEQKLRENRLRLFGHANHRSVDAVVKKSDTVTNDGSTEKRGRPKLTREDIVQEDLGFLDISA